MYEHFSEKFPGQFTAINVLARWDADLRAILADYEEISIWLAVQGASAHQEPDEIERARKLARELENEILDHLIPESSKT